MLMPRKMPGMRCPRGQAYERTGQTEGRGGGGGERGGGGEEGGGRGGGGEGGGGGGGTELSNCPFGRLAYFHTAAHRHKVELSAPVLRYGLGYTWADNQNSNYNPLTDNRCLGQQHMCV